MNRLSLHPDQIVTLTDFPVHNSMVLELYFRMYHTRCGNIIPFVPVTTKETVLQFFGKKLLEQFKIFEKTHPKAQYFMLDGSHRTTAATLTKSKIAVIVIKNNKDIREAKIRVKQGKGDILQSGIWDDNLEQNCKILNKHFKNGMFETVAEKTQRMIAAKVLPEYIVTVLRKQKAFKPLARDTT